MINRKAFLTKAVEEGFKNKVNGYPLTLKHSKGRKLLDYKIYGNTVQEKEMFDKSKMQSGFLPQTGAYPTTNTSYPDATYQIIEMKKGQVFNVTYTGVKNGRIRYIDNDTNEVVGTIGKTETDYYQSTNTYYDGFTDGTITAKKDFKLGVMSLIPLTIDFKLSIKSVVPTPDAPIEIQSVGDKIPVELFTKTGAANGYLKNDGTIVTSHVNLYYTDYIKTYGATLITQTYVGEAMNLPSMCFYTKDKTFISGTAFDGALTKIFTVPTNAYYFRTCYRTTHTTNSITSDTTGKYKIPITVMGKNWLKLNRESSDSYNLSTKKCIIGGAASNTYCKPGNVVIEILNNKLKVESKVGGYGAGYIVEVKPNTSYTISFETNKASSGSYAGLNLISDSEKLGTYTTMNSKTHTITTQSNTKYLYIVFRFPPADGTVEYSNIQLEEGTIATNYEPYEEPITTNIYLDEPLRKLGEYADYIDFKNKKVVRNVKSDLMYSKNLLYVENVDLIYFSKNNIKEYYRAFCTCLPDETRRGSTGAYVRTVTNVFRIYNRGYWDSLDAFKTWISEHKDYKVEYLLTTPTEEAIELPDILTSKYTNIITVDTTIQPSKIEAEYSSFVKEV